MAIASILIASIIWSCVPVIIKFSEPYFSSTFVAFARLALAALFVGLCLLARRLFSRAHPAAKPAPRSRRLNRAVIWAGVAFGVHYLFATAGIYRTSASATNIVLQVEVVSLVILGIVVLGERLSALSAAGMILCLVGVGLVVWSGESFRRLFASEYFLGNMLVMAAGICWSVYGLFQKIALSDVDMLESLFLIFLVGMAVSVSGLLASPQEPFAVAHAGIKPWIYVLTLGVGCTGVSYLFLAYGLKRLDASTTALITSPLPIFTILEAHWILAEPLTPYIWWGAALTVLGVIAVTLGEQKR
jgi:drug/metabolite transporter (DMT)-like permease